MHSSDTLRGGARPGVVRKKNVVPDNLDHADIDATLIL
jgi:hypothetical protein